jgi:hypothetical protein
MCDFFLSPGSVFSILEEPISTVCPWSPSRGSILSRSNRAFASSMLLLLHHGLRSKEIPATVRRPRFDGHGKIPHLSLLSDFAIGPHDIRQVALEQILVLVDQLGLHSISLDCLMNIARGAKKRAYQENEPRHQTSTSALSTEP